MVISTKYTHADLLAMPEDNKRREILDGELIVSPSPKVFHQEILMRLTAAFFKYLESRPIGKIFVAPLDVIFTDHDVLEPDLIFVLNENRHILQDWIRGVPDLMVEILSPGSVLMDRGPKLKAYARFGVTEYWIVDQEEYAIEVYRQSQSGYELCSVFGDGQTLTSQLLPEFSLPVASLFAD